MTTVSAIGIGICIAVVTLVVLQSKPRTGQRRLVAAIVVGSGFVVPLLLDPDIESEPLIGATLTVLAVVIGIAVVAAASNATEAWARNSRENNQ